MPRDDVPPARHSGIPPVLRPAWMALTEDGFTGLHLCQLDKMMHGPLRRAGLWGGELRTLDDLVRRGAIAPDDEEGRHRILDAGRDARERMRAALRETHHERRTTDACAR